MTLQVNRLTDDSGSGPPIFNYGFKLESNNSNWIYLKAPDALVASYTLTLPPSGSTLVALDADGTIKQTEAPYFCAEHSGTEAPAAGQALTSWSVQLNTGGASFGSGVYTCAKAGRYLITVSLLRNSTTATQCGIYLNKNNSNIHRITYAGDQAGYVMASGSYVLNLDVGDTIKLIPEVGGISWYGDTTGLGSFTITYLG